MSDEYLWDRSGKPDPEIEAIERTLAPLRYRHQPPASAGRSHLWQAAAAAVLLSAVALWQLQPPPAPATGWQVATVAGSTRIAGNQAAVSMSLHSGQSLQTGSDAQVSLQSDAMGKLDLGPDSELRPASTRALTLHRGTLHAYIWARPGLFTVDTASAKAIDLGCEYTLNVDTAGNGLLRVSTGWVAFQHGGHESFIPAGAQCRTSKRDGPGIPFYEDAPPALQSAVDRQDIPTILAAARPLDAITLWHLLTRVPQAQRGPIFDRFQQLVQLPPEVTRAAAIANDPATIDRCWNALNLENTDWWRGWERKW